MLKVGTPSNPVSLRMRAECRLYYTCFLGAVGGWSLSRRCSTSHKLPQRDSRIPRAYYEENNPLKDRILYKGTDFHGGLWKLAYPLPLQASGHLSLFHGDT